MKELYFDRFIFSFRSIILLNITVSYTVSTNRRMKQKKWIFTSIYSIVFWFDCLNAVGVNCKFYLHHPLVKRPCPYPHQQLHWSQSRFDIKGVTAKLCTSWLHKDIMKSMLKLYAFFWLTLYLHFDVISCDLFLWPLSIFALLQYERLHQKCFFIQVLYWIVNFWCFSFLG